MAGNPHPKTKSVLTIEVPPVEFRWPVWSPPSAPELLAPFRKWHLMTLYFDNAATSFPKPPPVYDAVDHYQRNIGAAGGRGGYRTALEATRIIETARARLARLIHSPQPDDIVFLQNGTDALNQAIHGLLQPGDHVVTTCLEHNSVLRPLHWLKQTQNVSLTLLSPDPATGLVGAEQFAAAIQNQTRLICLTHASNVTGAIQDIASVAQVASAHRIPILIDAAQTIGHVPLDVSQLDVDLLAFSGHKGLLGPLGTGALYVAPRIQQWLRPLRQGGTGFHSESPLPPPELPQRYEPGNHNLPGLAGLAAALDWLEDHPPHERHIRETDQRRQLMTALQEMPHITLYSPGPGPHVGVLSLQVAGYSPHDVAMILDDSFDIAVRAGLHCAPLAHQQLGTLHSGGTVRISSGVFTSDEDIAVLINAFQQLG